MSISCRSSPLLNSFTKLVYEIRVSGKMKRGIRLTCGLGSFKVCLENRIDAIVASPNVFVDTGGVSERETHGEKRKMEIRSLRLYWIVLLIHSLMQRTINNHIEAYVKDR